jgi:demethylmenaquinone methyltransferase / 2-methoxy-6-polyprenyl-1,4-benzoquinol methylase
VSRCTEMPQAVAGTKPKGTVGEAEAGHWVQRMFADIAPRYDLLNHLLSFNIDRSWRKALLEQFAGRLEQPGSKILDLCCGTGDVLLDLQENSHASVLGADFCHPMLIKARRKAVAKGSEAQLFEADALDLPIENDSLHGISIAFGFRNLANYAAGLSELHRVLKPGGLLAILEFSHPTAPLTRAAYGFYSRVVLPLVGGILSGSREAYAYLPASIKTFPQADDLKQMLEVAGYVSARYQLLSKGIAALHTGEKRA